MASYYISTVFFSQRGKSLIWVMFNSLKNFSVFKNSLLNLWPSRSFMFPSSNLQFCVLQFWLYNPFWLNFGEKSMFVSCLILLTYECPTGLVSFCWKDHPFYTELLWVFTKDQLIVFLWVYSGALYFCSSDILCWFFHKQHTILTVAVF